MRYLLISACTSGFWGQDCNHTCEGCINSFCNATNGVCHEGCQPGYKSTNTCTESKPDWLNVEYRIELLTIVYYQ